MGAIENYRRALRRSIDGRPLILTGGAVRAPLVGAARSLGSPKVMAIHEEAQAVGADSWATFAGDDWREAMEAFDPLHEALALGNNWQYSPELAGRRFVGRRRSEWAVFEDKTEVGRLWNWAGIACAPSLVVGATKEAVCAAAQALDQGQGTVWAGDHRDGEHHGGRHVRWARNNEQMAAATSYFGAHCDRVRVMPFLPGQPCTIHAFAGAGGMAVLRPIAMDIDLDYDAGRFAYRASNMSWAPGERAVQEVRSAAAAVGAELASRVGYRGAFCLDGILTAEGFRPTELNARWGASLSTIALSVPAVPLRFVHAFMADGEGEEWDLPTLERLVLERVKRYLVEPVNLS
jgi:hypothetical protein